MLVLKFVVLTVSVCMYFFFLRSVLSQAKQKTPLILPGFEAVDAPDDCSGQYSVRFSVSSSANDCSSEL